MTRKTAKELSYLQIKHNIMASLRTTYLMAKASKLLLISLSMMEITKTDSAMARALRLSWMDRCTGVHLETARVRIPTQTAHSMSVILKMTYLTELAF